MSYHEHPFFHQSCYNFSFQRNRRNGNKFLDDFSISSVNELLKIKDELTKERDEKLSEVAKLREELANATAKQQKAEQDREEAEMKIAEVRTYDAAYLKLFLCHCRQQSCTVFCQQV